MDIGRWTPLDGLHFFQMISLVAWCGIVDCFYLATVSGHESVWLLGSIAFNITETSPGQSPWSAFSAVCRCRSTRRDSMNGRLDTSLVVKLSQEVYWQCVWSGDIEIHCSANSLLVCYMETFAHA